MILISGMKCFYCDKELKDGDKNVMIPPFIENKKDSLYTDEILMHSTCFEKLPRYTEIEKFYLKTVKTYARFCSICQTEVTNPDDYYRHTVLTTDENSELYKYNYLEYHKSCYLKSGDRIRINQMIERMIKDFNWEYTFNKKEY